MIKFYIGLILVLSSIWGCWSNIGYMITGSRHHETNSQNLQPDFIYNSPEGITIHPTSVKRYKQIFYIAETKYFKIYFVKKDKDLVFNSAKEIDATYERLVDWYQHKLITPYEIYFLPDKRTIYRVTGETRDLGGVVTSRRGVLFIASENYNIQTVAHELSHLFLRKRVRERNVPRWFNEGLAEYLSTPQVDLEYVKNFILKKVRDADRLYTWKEMERNIMLRDAQSTYPQALSIILFLNDQYGKDKLLKLLNLYSRRDYHQSFAAAMSQVYGESIRDLERKWLNFIEGYPGNQ